MKILFIPHGPLLPDIRLRGEELAFQLAKKHKVLLLDIDVNYYGNIFEKIFFKFKQHFRKFEKKKYKNFEVIKLPYSAIYSLSGLKKRELSEFSLKFNRKILERIVKDEKIDLVVNESFFLWDCSELKVPWIYDIVDMDPKGGFSKFVMSQIKSANRLVSISNYINKELKKMGFQAELIPNGVNLKEFQVKERIPNLGKFRIGFIGNHAWWSGLDFLLDVFKELKGNYELYIVGGGSEVPKAKERAKNEKIENVIFTGAVPKKGIAKYFNSIDLGVLPFKKTILTDAAFPIKIAEYTACKKLVLATDLEELKSLGLSNVFLVRQDVKEWINAIEKLKDKKWNHKWDKEIEKYEWENLGKKFLKIFEELK